MDPSLNMTRPVEVPMLDAGMHRRSTAQSRGLSRRALSKVFSYIGDRLGEKLTLQEIASTACVSRFHFARLFRQSTGSSPMGYLLSARIARAKELLAEGDLSICEVAAVLGFCDQSHFSRNFRRLVGMTPRDYARLQADSEIFDGRDDSETRHAGVLVRDRIAPLSQSTQPHPIEWLWR
ncbi:AraC family transcriptional regulator [Solimonas sp. K1W22B-7]|uniref:helix-turn-helix domain-containing protein n=1 Tax=Solimonas sp. K1W22B-7 TaxID=2303331 RepID=UPI000E336C43|nr:AraC family transcriptional regulator [Solimonas sp. K1W22B-7]AXQ27512.1 AraC family transcriptional regulator [Solimonas sp. K1W22B-7]